MTQKNDLPFYRPSPRTAWLATQPLRWWFSPLYFGLENVQKGGRYLFVGNHTIYGIIDPPLYFAELFRKKDIYVRGLGDHYHFKVPVWGELLAALGAVDGTRENCARLMEAGQSIVVFPGGGREVCKRKGEAYKLIWKQRTGFARLAIQHGYPILPFASVGPENAYSIILDANDFLESWLSHFLDKKGFVKKLLRGGDAVPPIARGLLFTPLPRPERFYFSFGKPIETTEYAGSDEDPDALWDLRQKVEDSINQQFGQLLLYREQDTTQSLWRKVLRRL